MDIHIGSEFRKELELVVKKYNLRKIVETGTYDGLGSTIFFSNLLESTGKVYSIECNLQNYLKALSNLKDRKNVSPINENKEYDKIQSCIF